MPDARDRHEAGERARTDDSFRLLAESSVDTIMRFDRAARHLYVNPIVEAQTGIPPQQFIGKTHQELGFPEPLCELWERAILRVFDDKKPNRVEFQLPSGIWIDWLLTPDFDAAGEVRSVFTTARDITDRKRAERKTEHLNAILDAFRAVHQLLVHEHDVPHLVTSICQALVRDGGFLGAWAVLTDDQGGVMENAATGVCDDALGQLGGLLGRGELPECCHRARAASAAVLTKDTTVSCPGCPMAAGHPGSTALTAALTHEDRVLGYLVVSLLAEFADDPEETRLFQTVASDISVSLHARRTEAELRRQQQLTDMILAASSTGLAHAVDRKIVWANEAMERLFGYRLKEEYEGKDTRIMYSSDEEYERVGRIVYPWLQASRHPVRLDAQFVRRDGSPLHAHATMALLDPADPSKGIITSILDITDRIQAEEALRRSEEKYRTYVETAPESIFVVDGQGRCLDVNAAACELTGYTRQELLGMDMVDLAPESTPTFDQLRSASKLGADIVLRRKDGQLVHVHLEAVALSEDRYLGLCSDLTERRRAAAERAKLEEQLRQSQKMEAIGRLAGGVAHDFNNILTGINCYAELVIGGLRPDDPVRSDVTEILHAGEKAAGLVSQLLAYSRKQVADPRPVQANEVIERSQKMLRRIIGEEFVLEFVPAEDLGMIVIDPVQLDQVLVNLAVNARDAMREGGRLVIETRNVRLEHTAIVMDDETVEAHGDYVVIAVSDEGCGMDEETQQRIFEPFFSARKGSVPGTGLGLSTVYGIARQNDGFVRVSSRLGQGTTFELLFPRQHGQRHPTDRIRAAPLPQGKETILLVEDDDIVRRLAKRILEKQGYTVIEADGSQAAIQECAVHRGPIHLLLADVVMPSMNGKELHDRLLVHRPDLRVLFMSGYTSEAIVRRGVPEGEGVLVQKPFSTEQLSRAVRAVLARGAVSG